jgi:hypothetical protein
VRISLTQADWDCRASAVDVAWRAPVASATIKTPARCGVCGHEWLALPATIARGGGCPECGRWKRRRIPQQVWSDRLRRRGFELLEPVERSSRPVRVRCMAAGHVLDISPSDTRGCRLCRDELRHPPQWSWDQALAAQEAVWVEPVLARHSPTKARCLRCGQVRLVIPAQVAAHPGDSLCSCARRPEGTTRQREDARDAATASADRHPPVPAPTTLASRGAGADRSRPSSAQHGAPSGEHPGVLGAKGWIPAPVGPNETERLAALHALKLLDTGRESEFDELAALAAEICEAPWGFVSLVDEDREFFKAHVGTSMRESPRDRSFCGHAIYEAGVTVVPDALADRRFAGNPNVLGGDRIRFYAGAPLRTEDGHTVGMLCVKDSRPRELTDTQARTLSVLSRQVSAGFVLRQLRFIADSP